VEYSGLSVLLTVFMVSGCKTVGPDFEKPDVRSAELALVQYRQGAADYTRVLNTQTALLLQQDELTVVRGQVVSNLVAKHAPHEVRFVELKTG